MSRVFEALAKATQQKQTQADRSQGELKESLRGSPYVFKSSDTLDEPHLNGSASANGHQKHLPIVSFTTAHKNKTWRERIEELCFGWDLARYQNHPIVSLEQDSAASAQYKILREQVKRLRLEQGIDAFSITSPVKRDGKTTVAVNLACALALDYEERVLLIDGDLRAPGVHRYFNVPLSLGLGDYLTSGAITSVKTLVRETFLPSLRILTAGKTSHFSSELLAKEKMKHLIEEVKAEFPGYRIIIDSPPILSTPDPIVIARHVDAVLLVIRAGKTPRDYLTKALQSLSSIKLMGVVLNGANLGMSSQYYYYKTDSAY
jgi:protein-tyrosine kinase